MLISTPSGFKDHAEKYEMRKNFDYEDRVMVDSETGEVTMKMYYMHPGREVKNVDDKTGKVAGTRYIFCGAYFSAALWKEYQALSNKTRWVCMLDNERVRHAFPEEHAAAVAEDPDVFNKDNGTCGKVYRPWRDGPACLIEMRIDGAWIPLVSELLPEHILDRFKQAQAEWYKVL